MKIPKNWITLTVISTIVAIIVGGITIYQFLATPNFEPEMCDIRELIEQEASLVVDGRIDDVIDLFGEDAFVKDAAGGDTSLQVVWTGKNRIIERYIDLPDFVYLKHDAVEFQSVDNKCAEVTADTIGTCYVNGATEDISSNRGEKWTFQKINDEWKITGFTYNLP